MEEEDGGDGTWPLNNNPHNGGCSTPQIIKSGSYYYCFYTYWAPPDNGIFQGRGFQEAIDYFPASATPSAARNVAYGVGIARATATALDVPLNQYEMEDNPWLIYNRYDGDFTTPGFNGGTGSVQPGDGIRSIPSEPVMNMTGPRVGWHDKMNKWMMIAEGNDGSGISGNVIFTSDDLIHWDQGLTIFHWQSGTYYYKYFYCVFVLDTDKEFDENCHLYYLKATDDPNYTHKNNLHRWQILVDL